MSSRSPSVNSFPQPVLSTRPWCPIRPVPPPLGYLVDGDEFIVPGVAVVTAAPHRSRGQARAFARRIAAEPAAYLDVLTAYAVPGVIDRRPASHARGGTPFPQLAFGRLAVANG